MTVVIRAAACGHQPALVLRPWASQDIGELIAIYHDPVMSASVSKPIVTREDAHRWLAVQQDGWTSGLRLSFAALDGEAVDAPGRVVGNVVLKGYEAGRESAEIGYWTATAARGRGVASAAVEALTTWAFKSFGAAGLGRIELLHQLDNLPSCRVAQKCGYALTGVLPAAPPAFPTDGHLHTRYAG